MTNDSNGNESVNPETAAMGEGSSAATGGYAAQYRDPCDLLVEATEGFRALLTDEGMMRLDGTPKVEVRRGSVVDTDGNGGYAPIATIEATFSLILPPDSASETA